MAHPGRPRNHEPVADDIRRKIDRGDTSGAIALLRTTDVDVPDGEAATPFICAAFMGNLELMNWLREHGANIDAQDRNGWSALHFAIQQNHFDIVQWLVEQGAAIEPQDSYGNTPLWRATFEAQGDYRIVDFLVRNGADPSVKNGSGRSPLDMAETFGDKRLCDTFKRR